MSTLKINIKLKPDAFAPKRNLLKKQLNISMSVKENLK